MKLNRANSSDPRFLILVQKLDKELSERDGKEHAFYSSHYHTEDLDHVVQVIENDKPIACGAFLISDPNTVEVKRMYTEVPFRGKGFASLVLNALEDWALEIGITNCRLETGKRQPEAIALYKKNGYSIIPNFPPYVGVENSVCFEKNLN